MVKLEVMEVLLTSGGINMAALEAKMKDYVALKFAEHQKSLCEFMEEEIVRIKSEFMNELRKL